MADSAAVTYSTYLELDSLLSLQRPRSQPAEHDETLFIVIHQVYELWFKELLHEVGYLQATFEHGETAVALGTFKRILTILKTLVAQVDVLETMTPVSFSSFRTRLESASGFQSLQFRELEMALGKRDRRVLEHYAHDVKASARVKAASEQPTLYVSFLRHLQRNGAKVPDDAFEQEAFAPPFESAAVRGALIEVYRVSPAMATICERMIDLDEGLQEWRYRHVKMVERTIGTKPETGGSTGAEYLRTTLFRPLFPDLWAIRASL
jgi:tryptophan 2,3-dioxygenase